MFLMEGLGLLKMFLLLIVLSCTPNCTYIFYIGKTSQRGSHAEIKNYQQLQHLPTLPTPIKLSRHRLYSNIGSQLNVTFGIPVPGHDFIQHDVSVWDRMKRSSLAWCLRYLPFWALPLS